MLTRRVFLRGSTLAMVGIGTAPGWMARAVYAAGAARRKKILVAIFLRGAADGLNIVVPFAEKRYYELRPTIAIPKPSSGETREDSGIDLNGFFALHPSLAPLKTLYDEKHLAIMHACGSPDATRSHFDAQDYMESGTPGVKSTLDGWMNRALEPSAAKSTLRAVAVGASLPRSLRGRNPAVAVNNPADFRVRFEPAANAFESMYVESADVVLHGAGKDTFEAVRILEAVQKQAREPAAGADYPRGRLGQSLEHIARLIKADIGLEVAFAESGGWDHHVNEVGQRASRGQLANLLRDLGQSLAAFWRDLGDRMADVAVVTLSEFGRTAHENGNRGTDHGHANVMFVLGGCVRGGKVYGEWPGLEQERLYEGRDLALTTDFRDVLGELVYRHLGNRDLNKVFPAFNKGPEKFRGLVQPN